MDLCGRMRCRIVFGRKNAVFHAMKTRTSFLLASLSLLASLAAAQAFTWHVDAKGVPGAGGTAPSDALPSLQAAIDRAGDGDLIWVAEGEYTPVSFASSRSLTIRSVGGPEKTVLSGGGKTRCATFAGETGDAAWNVTLEGFTLEEGVDDSELGGGGVFGGNLVNCILRDNAAIRGGAASGSRLENCLLSGNVAALVGGGAFDSELVNCTVAGNRADGTGGGVCECKLANTIVQANDSPDGEEAAGCFADFSCTAPRLEGEGNFDGNPGFADAERGDWRLAEGSPCLDAGDESFCTSATDLAGKERIAGAGVDLGAWEGAVAPSAKPKAVPKTKTVTITFYGNGGTCGTPRTKTFRLGAKYAGFPAVSRPGFLCTGWFTAPRGGARITTNSVVSAGHSNFYAQWARATTVTFYGNGGTCGNPRIKTFRVGTKYSDFPAVSRPGFLCTGWFTAPRGGTRITTNSVVSASHSKFYAQWARVTTVTFYGNGGTCGNPRIKTFRVGTKYSGFPAVSRPGFLCTGWFTAPRGGTRITTNSVVSASHSRFYAQWRRIVTVSFNPNGGTCPVQKKTYFVGQPYASFPVPTRSGYTFLGWHTPNGIRVLARSTATTARTNLVARWGSTFSLHPVGDSMTFGVRTRHNPLLNGAPDSAVTQIANQGWRGYLNQTLVPWGRAKGRAVVFRGTHPQSSVQGNVPHDGYPGEDASSYADKHPAACTVDANVQIVLLGMNDAIAISLKNDPGSHVGSFQNGYARVLSALHAGSTTPLTILITEPEVTSLISKRNPLYRAEAINPVMTGYINPFIRSWQGPNVKILDIQSLFANASLTDDGFHFSVEGNKVVAARLANLVEEFWQGK